MERNTEQPNQPFRERVEPQRIAQPLRVRTSQHRSYRHPAQKHGEHENLGVCGVSHQEGEIARSDRFVDQSGSTRKRKKHVRQRSHAVLSCCAEGFP